MVNCNSIGTHGTYVLYTCQRPNCCVSSTRISGCRDRAPHKLLTTIDLILISSLAHAAAFSWGKRGVWSRDLARGHCSCHVSIGCQATALTESILVHLHLVQRSLPFPTPASLDKLVGGGLWMTTPEEGKEALIEER